MLAFASHFGSGQHHSYKVERHQAKKLYDAILEIAEKSGIKEPELRFIDEKYIAKKPTLYALSYNMYAGGTPEKPVVTIGKDMLKHLTGDAHGNTVNPEIKAILVHEFAHLKRDIAPNSLAEISKHFPLIGLFTAITALATYHHFQQRKDTLPRLTSETEPENSSLKQSLQQSMHPAIYAAFINGQYLAATALGIAGGMLGSRQVSHFIEFRADRFAAELIQDSKPMANAIKKIEAVPEWYIQQIRTSVRKGLDEGRIDPDKLRSEEFIKRIKNWMSHPSPQSRIERLESMQFPSR
jgi:Zn-dependent protease with chaperone function